MNDISFTAPDFGSSPKQYLLEVKAELKKVQWPSKTQVVNYTIMVLGISIVIGLFLGGLDLLFTNLLANLLR